jgi:1-acyl-sn-glycerol-3-phosphate acyltransferase
MLAKLARLILRLGGWTIVGGAMDEPKAVVIAAPHTSNWDGFWALTYKIAVGLDIHFFAKDSLFWFPLGNILHALGGIKCPAGKPAFTGLPKGQASLSTWAFWTSPTSV